MISRIYAGLPPSARGQRIGLFGGSFNPPHDGHRTASLTALRRLGLDRVWWMVTTGNPLKDRSGLPPLAERMEAAAALAAHPEIDITGFEAQVGSPYTCDLVATVTERRPEARFVFVMGADSFASLHQWKHWRRLTDQVPIAVIDRPGSTLSAVQSQAGVALQQARLDETDAVLLATTKPPAYVFLHGPRSPLSSTAIRAGEEPG